MNHEKTGQLIAQRRRQLGLTQKNLADKLSISDRAVSKWERGAGFPDISLVEPLADTLGLTVLELLHGQEEPPAPMEERTARETLQVFRPEVENKLKRTRRWAVIIAALALVLGAVGWLAGSTIRVETGQVTTTAAEATAISPYILITNQDVQLLETLWQEKTVAQINASGAGNGLVTLDEETIKPYEGMIDTQGLELTYFIVQSTGNSIHVEYGTELIRIFLNMDRDNVIEKGIMALNESYPYVNGGPNPDVKMDVLYTVYNQDNSHFSKKTYASGFAALLQ